MFDMPNPQNRNTCHVCLANYTNMCPSNHDFIGRKLSEPNFITAGKCHRFMITPQELEKRHKEVMRKLHHNIEVD